MALANNWFELRSDALKVTKHLRRPIPVRTDTIGPWLECMTNIVWVSALINPALVYLFSPQRPKAEDRQTLFAWALLAALIASHEFLMVRRVIRYLVERACWKGTKEQLHNERIERRVKYIC